MGAALIQLLRPLVVWLVQAGITAALYSVVDQILNKLQDVVRDYYGIDDKSAGAIIVNGLLDAAAFAGIGAAVLAKKIPLNAAKRLGLDVKSPAKKTISASVGQKIGAKDIAAAGKGAKSYLDTALKVIGIPAALVWLTNAAANIIEPGIYKPEQTNAVYKSLGIPFQYPTGAAAGTPGGFTSGEFTDYVRALETAGAYAISNPCLAQNVVFSRDAVAQLVDCIYGREAAAGNPTTASKLKPKLAPYIKTRTSPVFTDSYATSSASASSAPASVSSAPKVFTGIVSQGTLGDGTNFVPRPDDLITDVTDLEAALRNNLAPFLAAIPSRVIYEVKIQSSYTTRDGFTVRGITQRVQNGTFANGTPKYKSVTNKFAVANLYVLTAKGSRSKIDSIVLGPTDAVSFQPQAGELNALETNVRKTITTTYPLASKEIEDENGEPNRKVSTGPTAQEKREGNDPTASVGSSLTFKQSGQTTLYLYKGKYFYKSTQFKGTYRDINPGKAIAVQIASGQVKLENLTDDEYIPEPVTNQDAAAFLRGEWPPKAPLPPPPPAPPAPPKPKTLTEFYALTGDPLPSIQERAAEYDKLGLGSFLYYTGTAEQNAKLLEALLALG